MKGESESKGLSSKESIFAEDAEEQEFIWLQKSKNSRDEKTSRELKFL